jgi:hypothetical protein
MAKRATRGSTSRTRSTSTRSNAGRTASRSNQSGARRGRRPKSMEQYIEEDLEGFADDYVGDDYGDPTDFVSQLEEDAETYGVESPRVVSRARPGDVRIGNQFGRANRGRGQNQYTTNRGGRGGDNRGGGSDRSGRIRQLVNNFANDLIDALGD